MWSRHHRALLVVGIALGGLTGCADDEPSGGAAVPAPVPIPSPDLEGAEAPVRDKIRQARARVEAAPDAAATWAYLGVVLDAHGTDREAVVCYQRASELDPDDFIAPYLMALVLAADQPGEALGAFERAITLRPDSAVMRFKYADALLRVGRESDARAQYEAALEIDRDSRKALLGLGELALRRGSLEEARQRLLPAAQLKFHDREVHSKLARLYRRLGEPARAEHEALLVRAYPDAAPIADSVAALVRREAVSSKARTRRGLTHVARGQYAEAEREFRLAIQQRPDNARNHLNLAGVYMRQGRLAEAIRLCRQTLTMAPDDPEVHNNLAVGLIDDGQLPQAREHLETAIRLDPRHDGAHYNLGLGHEREGNTDEAMAEYRRAIEINPVNASAHHRLATLLARQGQREQAIEHWQAAVAFGRSHPEATVSLAMVHAREGGFGDAVGLLRQGLRANPNDVPMLAALVTILATCPIAEHRDGTQAVDSARHLIRLTGDTHVPSLMLLAAAEAESGDFKGAIRSSQRALGIAETSQRPEQVAVIRARLRLYESGRPYHQSGR